MQALCGVSLEIRAGEVLGLVGESGCGKSTLARLLLRLEKPSAGTVFVEGQDIWQADREFLHSLPGRIQMIFQDPFSSLNPRKTISSSIREGLVVHGMSRTSAKRRADTLLTRVGLLPEHGSRYPHEFSGGQRQRVAIARALALEPDILICDEPVSALDVSIQAQVLGILKELQDSLGLSLLFISHDLAVVSHISDRVAVMYLGLLAETAPADILYTRALHPYTQALLQAIPVPDPTRPAPHLALAGDAPNPLHPPRGCPFHPRCPQAMPICPEQKPSWTQHGTDHSVACHLY